MLVLVEIRRLSLRRPWAVVVKSGDDWQLLAERTAQNKRSSLEVVWNLTDHSFARPSFLDEAAIRVFEELSWFIN